MNSGYYAVVLDKKSQDAVKPNATMDVVNGDHITIAYKPNDKILKKLYKLIGQKVNAYFNEFRGNENIEAFWIKDMYLTETEKRFKRIDPGSPHITISHKEGIKPGEANTMFTNPTHKENRLGYVEGIFKWVPFSKKDKI